MQADIDFIYIANDPLQVRCADRAGVDRVMVDLEIIGKAERQGHLDTVISRHSLDDVRVVREMLRDAALLVRVNPINTESAEEIDSVLALGADIVMLPMFRTVSEVETFIGLLRGRARACLLMETAQSLARAEQILAVPGIDEVHMGLNDLHLAMGLNFMFELLAGGIVDHLASMCRERGIKFGFGGVARIGKGDLAASDIIAEHARVGSTQVILSRNFKALFNDAEESDIVVQFSDAVEQLRQAYRTAKLSSDLERHETRRRVCEVVGRLANKT